MRNALPILTFIAGALIGAFIVYKVLENSSVVQVDCPKFDYTSEPDFKHLDASTAHQLADNYIASQQEPTTLMPDGQADARCVNFKLSDLKKFIWGIESNICKCSSKAELGIRFYYGRYPDLNTTENPNFESVPKEYSFRHTLFLVPTIKEGDIFRDFDPTKLPADCKPIDNMDSSNYIMNHGNVCPPPFNYDPKALKASAGLNF